MDMEEEERMSKSEELEIISNLYNLLHLPPPLQLDLDGRTRQVLKNLLDSAYHILSCSEVSKASPRKSAAANPTGQQLVSDMSRLAVSSSHSDYPPPPSKRCRLCSMQPILKASNPVPSSATTATSVTRGSQPRMQKTSQVTPWSQPWLMGYSTEGYGDGFGRPGQQQHNCCCQDCRVQAGSIVQLPRVADLAMPAVSNTRQEVETTERRQTIRKRMLEEPKPSARGVESSSQGVHDENAVYLRDTMDRMNVPQRPLVKHNTEFQPLQEHQYADGLTVPLRMDCITTIPPMKAAKETKEKQMPITSDHCLAKAQSRKKHLKASTAIRSTMIDYEIPSSRKTQDHFHGRSRTFNTKSQRREKDSQEEWSSSVRSRSYTPSSSFTSYSWTSRQQTGPGSNSSSNSENFSCSDYNTRQSASQNSSTFEESSSGSSYASSSYHDTDGQDGDSCSRSTRYRRSGRERAAGRFKRFKDKLALIFHHHHHHHHHHHDNLQLRKSGNKATTWKPLRDMFHHEGRPKLSAEKAVVKKHGNLVEKNQGQHFNTLVQCLMHHVKNSKKSNTLKTSEVERRRMFRQQGGVKLPNRRPVIVGFKGKKLQLKER